MQANLKYMKNCAFCKFWSDPTNSCISPLSPRLNLWEFDGKMKHMCSQKNTDMNANSFCKEYECKLAVM